MWYIWKILVVEAVGFIGLNIVLKFMRSKTDTNIVDIDNMNNYYDVSFNEYHFKK